MEPANNDELNHMSVDLVVRVVKTYSFLFQWKHPHEATSKFLEEHLQVKLLQKNHTNLNDFI